MTDREIDALIANKLFSNEVPGMAPCQRDECGYWCVSTDGTGHPQPIYLAQCCCDVREEEDTIDLYGHYWACFEVVPFYSTSPVACALVLDEIERRGWCWQWMHDWNSYTFVFKRPGDSDKLVKQLGLGMEDNRYRAVCLAVLEACGATV